MKYKNEYAYKRRPDGYPEHVWTCIGRKGAMHFHVTDMGEEWEQKGNDRYSGGLETHHRQPPDYMDDQAPGTEDCWLLHGACWHDGTSLYAHERLIPYWLVAPHYHERMFRMLEHEYEERFNRPNDD
jgi:hypothetical protein